MSIQNPNDSFDDDEITLNLNNTIDLDFES